MREQEEERSRRTDLFRAYYSMLFVIENVLSSPPSSKYGICVEPVFADGQGSFYCTGLHDPLPPSKESSSRNRKAVGIGRKQTPHQRIHCLNPTGARSLKLFITYSILLAMG
jgi:hypothetical protein